MLTGGRKIVAYISIKDRQRGIKGYMGGCGAARGSRADFPADALATMGQVCPRSHSGGKALPHHSSLLPYAATFCLSDCP